jgi:hypothetical protein
MDIFFFLSLSLSLIFGTPCGDGEDTDIKAYGGGGGDW